MLLVSVLFIISCNMCRLINIMSTFLLSPDNFSSIGLHFLDSSSVLNFCSPFLFRLFSSHFIISSSFFLNRSTWQPAYRTGFYPLCSFVVSFKLDLALNYYDSHFMAVANTILEFLLVDV